MGKQLSANLGLVVTPEAGGRTMSKSIEENKLKISMALVSWMITGYGKKCKAEDWDALHLA